MYNRYIPQPDGTYHRKRMQDRASYPKQTASNQLPPSCPVAKPPCGQEEQCPVFDLPKPKPSPRQDAFKTSDSSVKGFLHNLLPKDFDTGDLLIVLLLLLMSGDCREDQNTALLTLALYFFM